MSIPVLVQVYEEVRRLAIAGSVVAPGDFRLAKLVPELHQLGQKAPVFTKVGEAATRLIESDERTSSNALLELASLVSAILYTQGETGAEGALEPIETVSLEVPRTQASARVLKPLMEALTTTGSGRLEIVRDAFERGAFADVRLMAPAVRAIDDPFPELAELVSQKILPLYGRAIFDDLKETFDKKSKSGGHVRRLGLMQRIDAPAARLLARDALEHGSKEVRVAAIECLGDSQEDLALLLDSAKSKAKDERAAAYKALGRSTAPEAVAALLAALDKRSHLELAVEPLANSRSPVVMARVVEAAQAQLALLLDGGQDREAASEGASRMMLLLDAMRGREDDAAGDILSAMFAQSLRVAGLKGQPSGSDLVLQLISVMTTGPRRAQSALVDGMKTVPAPAMSEVLQAACQVRSPAEVFELFSPFLRVRAVKKSTDDPAAVRYEAILRALSGGQGPGLKPGALVDKLDPRWLDLAVELKDEGLLRLLARPGHKGAEALLANTLKARVASNRDGSSLYELLEPMVRIGHPEATDAIVKVLEHRSKGRQDYMLYWIAQLIPRLPKAEAAPKLDALLPKLPDWMIEQLMDPIAELKRAP